MSSLVQIMDCCLFGNNPLSEPVMLATIHYLNQWCWQQSIIWTSDVGNNPLSEPVMLATIHYMNQWCWQQSIIWTSDVGNNPLSEPVMLATIHYLNQWCWQQSIIWTSDVGNNPLSEPVMNQWCCLASITHLPQVLHICQGIRSALVQIMACHLFSTKPLCKPMLAYC